MGDPSARRPNLRIYADGHSPKKAILAVTASMLTAAYYILRNGVDYNDYRALSLRQSAIRCKLRAGSFDALRTSVREVEAYVGRLYSKSKRSGDQQALAALETPSTSSNLNLSFCPQKILLL